jgi:hypothetical protein
MTPHTNIIKERLETASEFLDLARQNNERGKPMEVDRYLLKAEECIARATTQLSIQSPELSLQV